MKIEIDPEMMDKIIQQDLVETYVNLSKDIKNNYGHPDDLEMYKKVVAAIEVLSEWYFVHGEFEKRVKKGKKK